jgi:hypothetical protein
MVQENQTVAISTVNQHKADSQRMTNKDQREAEDNKDQREAEDQHKVDKSKHKDVVDKSQHRDVDDNFQHKMLTKKPGFPTGPRHFHGMEVKEYQARVDNSINIQSSYERFANLHDDEEELDVNSTLMEDDDVSFEKNKLRCFKVNDPGNRCHESKDHEMSARSDIAVMILNVMKKMNPNSKEEDLITMSNAVVDEIDSTAEVTSLEELFINSSADPHHNLNIITNDQFSL